MATAQAAPGQQVLQINNPARAAAAQARVWYPAASTNETVETTVVGANAVLIGTAAQTNAPIAGGRHPLVLIAHGGFRSAPNAADWFAAALASRGWIAAVVAPPGLPRGLPDHSVFNELVLRQKDLSLTLDTLLNDRFSQHIDAGRVGAVGFFLGAYSVLTLAGAIPEPDRFASSCQPTQQVIDCPWFARANLDLRTVGAGFLKVRVNDNRIHAAVAVAPEWSHLFSEQGLRNIDIPLQLIDLGAPTDSSSLFGTRHLRAGVPHAAHAVLSGAGRYSVFAQCQPEGAAILKAEGDDPALCRDGEPARSAPVDRMAIHDQLATMVSDWLNASLTRSR